jgi:hypothetical protein
LSPKWFFFELKRNWSLARNLPTCLASSLVLGSVTLDVLYRASLLVLTTLFYSLGSTSEGLLKKVGHRKCNK